MSILCISETVYFEGQFPPNNRGGYEGCHCENCAGLQEIGEGDGVMVVKYGSLQWRSKKDFNVEDSHYPVLSQDKRMFVIDTCPQVVGKIGIVKEVSIVQDRVQYSLDGIPGKSAWYDSDQLKLILKHSDEYRKV